MWKTIGAVALHAAVFAVVYAGASAAIDALTKQPVAKGCKKAKKSRKSK